MDLSVCAWTLQSAQSSEGILLYDPKAAQRVKVRVICVYWCFPGMKTMATMVWGKGCGATSTTSMVNQQNNYRGYEERQTLRDRVNVIGSCTWHKCLQEHARTTYDHVERSFHLLLVLV